MRNAFVVDSYIKKRLFFTISASNDLKTFEDKLYFFISFFFKQFLTFIHLHVFASSPLYLCLQPYLSVMLNKGSLEVLVFTGSHSPRRVVRPLDQGALNDGREHSLRIERLPGRLCACLCLRQSCTTALSDSGIVFFFFFCPSQVFCCSGGRGGQEGGCTSQRSGREPAPTLPRWYSCRGGADLQQSQRSVPGMYMEPDDQRCVRNFILHLSERL